MEKFKSFISEEIVDTYRIDILTVEFGDKSITAKKLEKEGKKIYGNIA